MNFSEAISNKRISDLKKALSSAHRQLAKETHAADRALAAAAEMAVALFGDASSDVEWSTVRGSINADFLDVSYAAGGEQHALSIRLRDRW